ncbi:MAG: outer membrane beta-barrel protein [Bacteroidetes bacterium]|nr:outer membrane beta-barrel protein [Fibrella sp.]
MKTARTLALLLLVSTVSLAQTTRPTSTTVIMNGDTTVTTTVVVDGDTTISTETTKTRSSGFTVNLSRDKASRAARRFSKDFGVYIGLNNYSGSVTPAFEVRPGASRFVALSWRRNIRLNGSRYTKLRLGIGPEIAWNNFAFEGNRVLINNTNLSSSARPGLNVVEDSRDLKKSKLTVCQFNVPVVLNIAFRAGLTLGVGAYAGIRLDSYTKVKPDGGDAVRSRGPYALNNVRWGLISEFGWQNDVHLFVRYEPSNLFRDGQGPDLNVWAVGFRL